MLLTIHNLPYSTRYADIKSLLQSKCGLQHVILDNLISEGMGKQVTVGVAEDADAAILVRKINGLYWNDQQLYVEDVRQQKTASEQPFRSAGTQIQENSEPSVRPLNLHEHSSFNKGMANMMVPPITPMMAAMYYMPNYTSQNYMQPVNSMQSSNFIQQSQNFDQVPQKVQSAYMGFSGFSQTATQMSQVGMMPLNTNQEFSQSQSLGQGPVWWDSYKDKEDFAGERPMFGRRSPAAVNEGPWYSNQQKRETSPRERSRDDSQQAWLSRGSDNRPMPSQPDFRSGVMPDDRTGFIKPRPDFRPNDRPGLLPKPRPSLLQNPRPEIGFDEGRQKQFSGRPNGFSGRPNELSGRPNVFSGRPNEFSGRPNEFSGRPNDFSGKPKEISGRPNEFSGRPNEFSGRPNEFSGRPNEFSEKPKERQARSNEHDGFLGRSNDFAGRSNERRGPNEFTGRPNEFSVKSNDRQRRPNEHQGSVNEYSERRGRQNDRPQLSRPNDRPQLSRPNDRATFGRANERDEFVRSNDRSLPRRGPSNREGRPERSRPEFPGSRKRKFDERFENNEMERPERVSRPKTFKQSFNKEPILSVPEVPPKPMTEAMKVKQSKRMFTAGVRKIIYEIYTHLGLQDLDVLMRQSFRNVITERLKKLLGVTLPQSNFFDMVLPAECFQLYRATYPESEDQATYDEALAAVEKLKADAALASEEAATLQVKAAVLPKPAILPKPVALPKPVVLPKPAALPRPGPFPIPAHKLTKAERNVNSKIAEATRMYEQGKVPTFPGGDKRKVAQHKKEEQEGFVPEVDFSQKNAIKDEVDKIVDLFVNELNNAPTPRLRKVYNTVDQKHLCIEIKNNLIQHLSKRVSNNGLKVIRIYGCPKLPKREDLEQFMIRYGAQSLRKSVKSKMYTSSIETYENYDILCDMDPVTFEDGNTISFKPFHLAPRLKADQNFLRAMRKKIIRDMVDRSDLNLLDKDWPAKQDAINKQRAEAKKEEDEKQALLAEQNEKELVDVKDQKMDKSDLNKSSESDNDYLNDDFHVIDEVNETDSEVELTGNNSEVVNIDDEHNDVENGVDLTKDDEHNDVENGVGLSKDDKHNDVENAVGLSKDNEHNDVEIGVGLSKDDEHNDVENGVGLTKNDKHNDVEIGVDLTKDDEHNDVEIGVGLTKDGEHYVEIGVDLTNDDEHNDFEIGDGITNDDFEIVVKLPNDIDFSKDFVTAEFDKVSDDNQDDACVEDGGFDIDNVIVNIDDMNDDDLEDY